MFADGRAFSAYTMMRATWLALFTLAIGCGGRDSDGQKTDPPVATTGSADEPEPVDGPPKRVALTADQLAPIIHELGVDGAVPTAVTIELATPIIDADLVGGITSKSVLKITPEIKGRLTYASVSGLRFTPDQPFAFDTRYTFDLQKIETRDGELAAPASKWSYTFQTPRFAFRGWAPQELDVEHHRATMELTFSGAVLPNVALAKLTLAVDGKKPAGVQVLRSPSPTSVVVQLSDPAIALGAKLSVAVAAGLPSLMGAEAAAAKAEYVIANDKAVTIKDVEVVEGANGFYLEVVCDDKAAGGSRSHYARGSYYALSSRCQLSDDAIKKITFSPPVKGAYIAGGRAGFRVFGEFQRGAYKVAIGAGAASIDGGVTIAPYAESFSVKARRPALAFAASGRYLPRTAWNNLGIKHTNVDAVNLIVRHIPQENLVFWMSGQQDAADERTSNLILKKTIPLRANPDASATTWLDVAALLPATTKGVLELKLVGLGVQSTSRLLLTNMSLVAKKTSDPKQPWHQTVKVWALDMDSGALLDGVDVSLVRMSGKSVARCSTAGTAGCTLDSKSATDPDQAEPFAIIARKGDDLTYIRYADLKSTVAESNTSGQPYTLDTPYRAAVYADRGVYRPGDTAHVTAIVRDAKDRAPDQPLPVDVKLIDPRAKVARKLRLETNPGGVIAFDHALPAFADTGHWYVQFAVADKPLASYGLQVEEFVPERMAVTAAAKRDEVLTGSKVEIDVAARYLFGGNAMDSGVELSCAVEPTRFAPETNGDFTYGVQPRGKAVPLGEARGQLDPAGKLTIACPEATTPFTQTADLTATVSVLEAGSGRATVRTASATIHPEKFYIGLKSKATRAMPSEPFTVDGMIVDWEGKPVRGAVKTLRVDLLHLEADYGYGYDEYSGESRYDRSMREVPEGKREVAVGPDGKFSFEVTPGSSPAGYAVRVSAGKAKSELVLDGEYPYDYYGYYEGDTVDQTPRPARPTQLKLDLPKDVEVGKAVTVKVKTPYKGKLLWTVETDHVLKAEWKDATSNEATWSFAVDQFAPNVYVSAFLVKDPHQESKDAFMPDRALGIASARVVPTVYTQAVRLDVPKEIRSASPLAVTLDLGPQTEPTFATIAVVDEGILSLTGFSTPNPLVTLFAKRALGVETFETIGWTMLHQAAGTSSKTGGGDDYGEEESGGDLGQDRVQPVKPVALFSGVVPVPMSGKVTVPFEIPTYRGQLRVMAITSGTTKVGRAEAKVTVRDPLVVQVTFPRFVTQGDELQIPVFLTNVSGAPLDVTLSLVSEHVPVAGLVTPASGPLPLTFTGQSTGKVRLEDGRAETLVFAAKGAIPVGGAKLRVVAKATGRAVGTLEVRDEVEVPFLPAGPKERVVQKVKIDGTRVDLKQLAALRGWAPTSERTTFWLTTNPYGEAFEHLKYLIHYPYGCIEQTTSTTRPLLYIGALAEQVDDKLAALKIEDMVLAGINRVLSMETPSGGFGYWPGSTEPLEWATAYATHMLLDAKRAGYAVPDDRMQEILAWIENRIAQYERGQRIARDKWSHYDEQSEAYLHYVLAIAGKGKKARILKLISAIPKDAKGEQAEDLYLLKAALYLAGDRRYAKDLKAVDSSPIKAERINSWSFYSDLRRRGLMLATFFDLFGNDPAGELLAQRVAEGLVGRASSYYNTQELVWGVTGLGKWVRAVAAKGTAAGTLTANGKVVDPRKTRTKSNDTTWAVARASEYDALVLDVPASAQGLWLVVNSEGVRTNATYKVGGNGLAVSRTYRDQDGEEIDVTQPDALRLGDVLFVEIELANTSGAYIQNIALVDRLPAGFEIENPRLGRTTKIDWVDPQHLWAMDFMNMRDDRLQAFGGLAPGAKAKIVYSVRAVTSGKFTVPPIEAEAMYDPTLWARAKGGTAIVGGPWTGKTI